MLSISFSQMAIIVSFATVLLTTSSVHADYSWLVPILERERSSQGPKSEMCVFRSTNTDRAAVIIEKDGITNTFIAFNGQAALIPFRIRTSTPLPRIASLQKDIVDSQTGLPFPAGVSLVQRIMTQGPQALPLFARMDFALTQSLNNSTEVWLYDDGFITCHGVPGGQLASVCGLRTVTFFLTAAGLSVISKREITHFHLAMQSDHVRMFSIVKSIPNASVVRSFGYEEKLGLAFYCDESNLFVLIPGGTWKAKPFVADAEIIARVNQCRSLARSSDQEQSLVTLPVSDLLSLKALACQSYTVTMPTWNRHPRFYVQKR